MSDARITFSAAEIGLANPERGMSRLTENFNLQRGLLRHLESLPQVKLIQRTKVNSIVKPVGGNGDWPLVHLSDGRVLRSRLLVRYFFQLAFSTNAYSRLALTASTHLSGPLQELGHLDGPTMAKQL